MWIASAILSLMSNVQNYGWRSNITASISEFHQMTWSQPKPSRFQFLSNPAGSYLHHSGEEYIVLENVCKSLLVLVEFIQQVVWLAIWSVHFLPAVNGLWCYLSQRLGPLVPIWKPVTLQFIAKAMSRRWMPQAMKKPFFHIIQKLGISYGMSGVSKGCDRNASYMYEFLQIWAMVSDAPQECALSRADVPFDT